MAEVTYPRRKDILNFIFRDANTHIADITFFEGRIDGRSEEYQGRGRGE